MHISLRQVIGCHSHSSQTSSLITKTNERAAFLRFPQQTAYSAEGYASRMHAAQHPLPFCSQLCGTQPEHAKQGTKGLTPKALSRRWRVEPTKESTLDRQPASMPLASSSMMISLTYSPSGPSSSSKALLPAPQSHNSRLKLQCTHKCCAHVRSQARFCRLQTCCGHLASRPCCIEHDGRREAMTPGAANIVSLYM